MERDDRPGTGSLAKSGPVGCFRRWYLILDNHCRTLRTKLVTIQYQELLCNYFQSSLKVFLLIGMAFWLASCLPKAEEEEVSVSAPATSWYEDTDGDTYGDPDTEFVGDQPDLSWVTDNTDCDDTNANANPSEIEIADRVDNDCDDEVDDGFKYAFATSSTHTGNLGWSRRCGCNL